MTNFKPQNIALYENPSPEFGTSGTTQYRDAPENTSQADRKMDLIATLPAGDVFSYFENHIRIHVPIIQGMTSVLEYQKRPLSIDDLCARVINRMGGCRDFCKRHSLADSSKVLEEAIEIGRKLIPYKMNHLYVEDELPILKGHKTWTQSTRLPLVSFSRASAIGEVTEVPNQAFNRDPSTSNLKTGGLQDEPQ